MSNRKREAEFILDGSPCDTNFHADGPRTVAEARRIGKSPCPHLAKCNSGGLNTNTGFGCTLMYGRDIAAYATKEGGTVHDEAHGDFLDFFETSLNPPRGFVWSPDRKTFVLVKKSEAFQRIKEFASQIVS